MLSLRTVRLTILGITLAAFGTLAACSSVLGDFDVNATDATDGSVSETGTTTGDGGGVVNDDAREDSPVITPDGGHGDAGPDACVGESDAVLCTNAGKNCGGIVTTDRCGVNRAVPSCGTCTLPQSCSAQTPNVCGCTPESDTAFCSRLGKNCGPVTAADNCGQSRSVASCGSCTGSQSCGTHLANVCGDPVCTPETDAAFCARYGATCGPLSQTDNCGTARQVPTCGSCTSPQTCGAVTANQCGCVKESDASFCARSGHTCGSLVGSDNCGNARSVSSCGTCLATNSCSAQGICVCGTYAACTTGQTCCSTGCFNVGSDPNNCSACGKSCGTGDGWECYAGGCGCGVRADGHICGNSCVLFQTNANCASCGNACDVAGGDWCCPLQGQTVYACRYGGDCAR
jgi:hypothetical protein